MCFVGSLFPYLPHGAMSVSPDSDRHTLIPPTISLTDFTRLDSENAARVLDWRNHEQVRRWMLRNSLITEKEHQNFLENLRNNPNRQYHMVQLHDEPIGVVDFYTIDPIEKSCCFGHYLNPDKIGSSLGIVLEFIAAERSLIEMELRKLVAETMPDNTPAMELHRAFGFENTIINASGLQEAVLDVDNWNTRRESLAALVERLTT